jgi:hypothetical protein
MSRSDLERLSKEELIELVLKLHRPETVPTPPWVIIKLLNIVKSEAER